MRKKYNLENYVLYMVDNIPKHYLGGIISYLLTCATRIKILIILILLPSLLILLTGIVFILLWIIIGWSIFTCLIRPETVSDIINKIRRRR